MEDLLRPFFPGWPISAGMLGVAIAADSLLPEPTARVHPVVWIGSLTGALTGRFRSARPAAAFAYGCAVTAFVTILAAVCAWGLGLALLAIHPVAFVVIGGLALKTTFAVRGLERAAGETAARLNEKNLQAARHSLSDLVSRDPSRLTEGQVAAAAIESVAENTTDSFLAPWLFFAIAGLPGAFFYRAVNTLDSMIGYRGEFEYLGKSAARLDDALNYLPARIGAIFVLLGGTAMRLNFRQGLRTAFSDHRLTASPNAGWTMAAMSGLLKVKLEKPGHYALGAQFPEPNASHISDAVKVARLMALMGVALALAMIFGMGSAL